MISTLIILQNYMIKWIENVQKGVPINIVEGFFRVNKS
jgi:hypothetical protein